MPDRYGWSRNEPPLAPHAYTHSAFELVPQSSLWPSPLTSRRDIPSCPSSDADYSRDARTYSHTDENVADIYAYPYDYSSSPILQDGAGMFVGSWAASDHPPALEHDWGILDGELPPATDLTFHISNDSWPEHCGTHIHGPINTLDPPPWMPLAWDLEYSRPPGLHYDSSSCDISPVSPMQHEQSRHLPRCDSAGPYILDMPHAHDQGSIYPRWDAIEPGSLGDNPDKLASPVALRAKHTPDNAFGAETLQEQDVLGPMFEVAGGTAPGSRPICSRCSKRFSHSTDLTRHMKTQHGLAGDGYRCAFPGCLKVHKVWSRLDSFKKHMRKQHQVESNANMKGWVEKSATGDHGLPIAMTSLSGRRAGSLASQLHHSVSL